MFMLVDLVECWFYKIRDYFRKRTNRQSHEDEHSDVDNTRM